jgi:hypothetical protein
VEKVADDERLVNVELKLAVHTTNGGGDVVTHDLGADHSQSLTLSGVDLARHDAATGLVLGQVQLTKTAARATAKVSDILSNLGERGSKGVERAVSLDNGIVSSQSLKLVRGSLKLSTGHLGDLLSDSLGKALEGVDASTNSSTALGEKSQIRQRALNTLDAEVELSNVAGELLGESKRGSVLEMSSADLDDLLGLEVVNLLLESIPQTTESRQELTLNVEDGSDVHNGGESVVGRGTAVDVVVGVDGLLAAHGTAEDLNSTVGDNLVGVHIGLSSGTSLPDDEGEVVKKLSIGNLLGSLLDSLTDLGVYGR